MNRELTPRTRPHVQARTVAGEWHQALAFSLLALHVTMKKSVLGLSLSMAHLPPGQMNSLPLQTLEPTGQDLTRWAMLRVVFETSHSSASPPKTDKFLLGRELRNVLSP